MAFGDETRRWTEQTKTRLRVARYKIALEIFGRVILRTPVDTGRARANWQTTVGSPASGTIDGTNQQEAVDGIRAQVGSAGDDESVFLTNNLPYIEALEDGHSQQAPNGMVALTIAEFDSVVAKVAEEVKNANV